MTLCQETNRESEEYAWEPGHPWEIDIDQLYRCKYNVNTFKLN